MKKIIYKIWPLLLILAIWFVFSSPYFVKGRVPFPSTYLATNFGPWNEYSLYLGPVKNGAAPDVIGQIYPWKKLVIESLKEGNIPLWNPHVFLGTPLLANYQSAALSPINLLYFVLPFVDAWSIQVLLQSLLAGVFMYLFVRSLKLSQAASALSSIAFMFCGFITTWGVYGLLGYAILFLPLALFAIEKFYETKKWYFSALLALSIPLSFLSGHFQMSLYFIIFTLSYCVFKFLIKKDFRLLILNLMSIGSGILISAPQLLATMELYSESVRSSLFMKTEVIPWSYLPTFLAPDFFGNPVTRNDWFGHYAEWNAYVGIVPLFLAVYSIRRKNLYILFFAASSILALLFAFQTPLLDLLIALKIPVLSTSAASRIIVLFSFSLAVLAGFGLDRLLSDIKEREYKRMAILSGVFVLIFALLWVTVALKLFIPIDKIPIALSNLKFPSLIFAALIAVLAASYIMKKKKMVVLIVAALIIITILDMLRFATKWQPYDSRALMYPEVPVSKFIATLPKNSRAFGNFGQELSLMLNIGNPEGYDPLYIGRYGEFINAAKDGNYHMAERSVALLSKNGQYTGKVINFLGIKYIIHKVGDGQAIWAFPFWTYPVDQFRSVYKDDKYEILENDKASPRAFIVSEYKVVNDKRKILQTIFHKELDISKNVVLEEDPKAGLDRSATGSAVITKQTSSTTQITTNTTGRSILVLPDPYYPGWNAYIDGAPTKIYRANYAFRAIVVPKGEHVVSFTYEPDSFKMGLMAALLGIVGIAGSSLYLWKKKSRS